MKKLAIAAIKGGVGKSTLTAKLAMELRDRSYKVGLLDIDITSSTLSRALGIPPPAWQIDGVNEKIIVPEVDGMWLLAIASHVGEDYAVLWGRSQHKELTQVMAELTRLREHLTTQDAAVTITDLERLHRCIDDILASSKWRFVAELLSEAIVTWPVPLDFLLADLPPSTSEEMLSFLEGVGDLFGAIIVSQPSQMSTIGLVRTIDLFKTRQIPIVGLVANQDGFLNCHGETEYQFLSPRVDIAEIARKAGVPFLMSIPQCGDLEKLKPYFSRLADKVLQSNPVVLREDTLVRKLKRQVLKGAVRLLTKIKGDV